MSPGTCISWLYTEIDSANGQTYPTGLANWDLGVEDGINWNTPLLNELLYEVTVVIIALAVVRSHIPSAWMD